MYPAERREALLRLIRQKGFVSIRDLAAQLQVSEITIRRDLKALARQGFVETVTGGGQAVRSASEPSYLNKRVLQQSEKQHIAERALDLIESGMTIGLSAGTTTWTLAQLIKPDFKGEILGGIDTREASVDEVRCLEDLTFVTNSTNVAMALYSNGWRDIHLTGGQFRTPSDAIVGPFAEDMARKLHTDLLFLGTHGIDLTCVLTTPNIQEASINRVFMEQAQSVILLFDHTKWGIRALTHLADLDEIDIVVTNAASSEHNVQINELRMAGPEVLVVNDQQYAAEE